jgi:hypothetical protein
MKELTLHDLINDWMVPYHGTTIEKAYEENPWKESMDFYDRYPVTQEQHDEWNEKAKEKFSKHFKLSKKGLERHWPFTYLDASPKVV